MSQRRKFNQAWFKRMQCFQIILNSAPQPLPPGLFLPPSYLKMFTMNKEILEKLTKATSLSGVISVGMEILYLHN